MMIYEPILHNTIVLVLSKSTMYKLALVVVFVCLSTCNANKSFEEVSHIQLLRPRPADVHRKGVDCLSWRLAVETYNIRDWILVPASCEGYVGNYMLGKQYRDDCDTVADTAIEYAKSYKLVGDGKDAWVFDIDETTLSNVPYYARSDVQFGTIPYNSSKFNAWVGEGKAPAIPAIRKVYKAVQALGFKTIFLTGTEDKFLTIRAKNLKNEGYTNWEKLILKGPEEHGAGSYKVKKRTELVEKEGYRIIGNIGDQWSDLLGDNAGIRTFKVPDPMYYIA